MKARTGGLMVNTGVVNARVPCLPHAAFCESFAVFAQIMHLKNTVKYERIFEVNQTNADLDRTLQRQFAIIRVISMH